MSQPSSVDYKKVAVSEPSEPADAPATAATYGTHGVHRPWHYGMFTLCCEMNSCLEVFLCAHCQLSRQFNMVYNMNPEMHYPVCLATFLLDWMGVPAGFALQYVLRSDIRRRYGIEGNIVQDCCTAWFCTPCVVQQQFLELTSVGACPGMSLCGVAPVLPDEPYMI